MLKWFKDYFTGRSFAVRIGNTISSSSQTKRGVPQGSVLSPLLFLVLLANLPVTQDTKNLMYADDLSIFSMSTSYEIAQRNIQNALNRINDFLKSIGLKINPNKSVLMLFSRKKISTPPFVTLNNTQIKQTSTFRFLGVTLDAPFLTWRHHINHLKIICSRRLNILKSLTSTTWGASRNIIKTFYTSFIKSKIDYGIQVYSSASKTELAKLEVIQNAALRTITGLRMSTHIPALQHETKIFSIHTSIKKILIKTFMKITTLNKNHITLNLIKSQLEYVKSIPWTTFPHKSPFIIRAMRACADFQIETSLFPTEATKADDCEFTLSPWFNINEVVNLNFLPTKKNELNRNCVNQQFQYLYHIIYNDWLKIFTDGSKQENKTVGSAIFIESTSETFSWKLQSSHSIIMAELFSILMALNWIYNTISNQSVVIFTDSLTALHLILDLNKKSHKKITSRIHRLIFNIKNTGSNITLQWIPSHKGIHGNEVADQVSKHACEYDAITNLDLEFEENYCKLIGKIKETTHSKWLNDKTTLFIGQIINNITNWTWQSSGNRKLDVIMARFRNNSAGTKEVLFKIKKADDPYCDHCRDTIESSEHFILNCPNYNQQRQQLKDNLSRIGIYNVTLPVLLSNEQFPKKYDQIMRFFNEFLKSSERENL